MSDQRTKIDRTASRRERRAAQRSERPPVRSGPKPKPAWQSPIALITGGAFLIGAVIIGVALFSTGQVGADPTQVKVPQHVMPDEALWDGRALGSADAPLLIEAFEDYQCPACGLFSTRTQPELVKDYVAGGIVRFVYKDFAFIGQESLDAAVAARCAEDQGKYWPFHEYLFSNQKGENEGRFDKSFLLSIAAKLSLDGTTFESCLATPEKIAAVEADNTEAKKRGVGGTPTLFLNGELLEYTGGYADLKSKIDTALGAAQ